MRYVAPIEEMNFLLEQVFEVEKQLGDITAFADFDLELYRAILQEAAKFSENRLFPLNRSGDEEECQFNLGKVTTPDGFKQAYKEFGQGGWLALSGDPEFGGQGLPRTLHVLIDEMNYAANSSFNLYASLTCGAYHTIHAHANDTLKQLFLPPILEGRWAGAMCLTESHAGSDLGLIKTKAVDNGDGSYQIDGSKIFITGGDQDLTDNIVHLVLAKLSDSPEGPQGISLFLVPKLKVNPDGSLGEANGVNCGSIEHKMGIKGSATCTINFDGAQGYLVGELNRGLFAMFTMMNLERLSIGIQGIGLAEVSYQLAKAYACERKQGKNTAGVTANIIEHTDVRRMLVEQRALIEPARALAVFMGLQIDRQYYHPDEPCRTQAAGLMALLTPVAKAFFTDKGYEACNHGMQVLGGHGYIREWGLEQLVRDAKIAQIYEGTNGIQAQDLLVRKICQDKQGLIYLLYRLIEQELAVDCHTDEADKLNKSLTSALAVFKQTTEWLRANFTSRSYELQGGAVDYLHATGYLVFGWMWLKMLNSLGGSESSLFNKRKRLAASYFTSQQLPQLEHLCDKVRVGYADLAAADNELI